MQIGMSKELTPGAAMQKPTAVVASVLYCEWPSGRLKPRGAGTKSAERKMHAMRDIHEILERVRRQHRLPAIAGGIVTSEGPTALGATGYRRWGGRVRVTDDDQFHLGSCTKAMTALLIASMVEQGLLKWDATLADLLPEFAKKIQPAYRKVTMEHLLCHRAGLSARNAPRGQAFISLRWLPGSPSDQRAAFVERILRESPEYEIGARFLYSNRNYIVAGFIAESLADEPWETLMRKRIFEPLDMSTAGIGPVGSINEMDQPWPHLRLGALRLPVGTGPWSDNPLLAAPAGIAHCSMRDWGKFLSAHLRGEQGSPGILQPDTFRKIHQAPFGDYAYGWKSVERPWAHGAALMHAGSNTLNMAVAWLAPKRDFGVMAATNVGGQASFIACDELATALIRDCQQAAV